jgi:hypothetical protein
MVTTLLLDVAVASIESDNCAAIAAGFPIELAAQLCVTCNITPTHVATSSGIELAAVISIAAVAGALLLIALILCCAIWVWYNGILRTLAAGTTKSSVADEENGPLFQFADEETAAPPPDLTTPQGLEVDFEFDQTGTAPQQLPPGVAGIEFEAPGAPGSVVNFRFAEPGEAPSLTSEYVPVQDPMTAALLAPLPASANVATAYEQRGRSRSLSPRGPRGGRVSLPALARASDKKREEQATAAAASSTYSYVSSQGLVPGPQRRRATAASDTAT